MIPYIVAYFINLLFACVADVFYKQKPIYILSLFLIIVVDTIFVGLRDFGVGIDTTVYIDDYFLQAKNIHSFSTFMLADGYDKAFLLLAKIATLFSKSSQSLLVFTELFIISFTILGANVFKKNLGIKISIFLTLYWLIYLCHSENLMRQYCAMAILFWGFAYLLQGRTIIYIISQICAFFFHSSSIVFLLAPVVYFVSKAKSDRIKWIFALLALLFIIIGLLSYYTMLEYVSKLNILKDVYSERYGQSSVYEREGGVSLGIRYILQTAMPFLIIFWAYIKKALKPEHMYMLIVMFLSMVLLEQLRFIMIYMFRLAHYFGMIYLVYMSLVMDSKKIAIVLKITWLALLVISFWKGFMTESSLGWDYRYSSKILGI
ncbi:MAG: EpsG family protein [Bacteroidales bacterium]|nr:EpsG family protein [Bacteroidales bacterium]